MDFRIISAQKPKAAILHQITGIIRHIFRDKSFKRHLHFLPGQSIHPALTY
ncbi:hypothetical protein HanXRQr2_Chr16g0750361 [Helianthus annuus]|uniref:Uncharacterized protein n=1 Tax=Helianthus annuus TaxID=4232 RepID=A0A9K3GYU8_HELAN|nr:hypothetical protein HanXRQr2_Chr16g0750361 [Helianthus annuus]KAJ0438269.1 hypothetical protein HanHA300_Chr16g0612011 [Helianthus annuus]KAJ0460594.1 hypothetical protein HanHA89_Chr16g0662601 [Helianthus annuus]